MRLFVAITDNDWFAFLSKRDCVDEVNFWSPSGRALVNVAQERQTLVLFKLKSPENSIVGGGFFVRFQRLPVRLAWQAFGEANGCSSFDEMQKRIARLRHEENLPESDPEIGCTMLAEPFFWDKSDWLRVPKDFSANTQRGKGYDSSAPAFAELWDGVQFNLSRSRSDESNPGPATIAALESHGLGSPYLVMPRLGQGTFRILIRDAYGRCAMTGERTLPALEAAHIKPFSMVKRHELSNGLLLRSDLHRL